MSFIALMNSERCPALPRSCRRSLPEALERDLEQLGAALARRGDIAPILGAVLTGMAGLPAGAAVTAEDRVRTLCNLDRSNPPENLLTTTPGLQFVFLFHGNGRLREASLDHIRGPLTAPFWVSAIAHRLNDWAQPVRAAAFRCARRVLPITRPEAIADAALFLLEQRLLWRRWRSESSALEDAFRRPDVARQLADRLIARDTGPMRRVLGQALRWETIDLHLIDIGLGAIQPGVRALALRTLIDCRARWFERFGRDWINKPFNLSRRIPILGERDLPRLYPVHEMIGLAARDRSPIVRKIAADALIERRGQVAGIEAILAKLGTDSNRPIRERIEFLLKRQI